MLEQIAKNKRSSVILLAVVFCVLLGLGYFIGFIWTRTEVSRLYFIAGFAAAALLWAVIAYFWAGSMILAGSGAHEVTRDSHTRLFNVVEEMSIAAGVPVPRICVIDDPASNAFATGRDPRHAAVAVTSGLLQTMNRQELQGVVAHEMSHVRNYDIRFGTLVTATVGVIALCGVAFLAVAIVGLQLDTDDAEGESESGGCIGCWLFIPLALLSLVCAAAAGVAFLCSSLMALAISRKREYLADATAVRLTRDPLALARALEKMAADPVRVAGANAATANLYITNPLKRAAGWAHRLFDTHPPIEKRIQLLRTMAHQPLPANGDEGEGAPLTTQSGA